VMLAELPEFLDAPGWETQRTSILHAVLDPMCEALVVVDRDGKIIFANRAAQASPGFGLPDDQPQDPAPCSTLLARILRGEVADGQEVCVAGANPQDSRWLKVRLWPLVENAVVSGSVILVRDTTAPKQAAETHARDRQDAEGATRAKSEFLRRATQELRSHLNSILGFTQMLAVDNLTPQQRDNVQRILTGGYHVLELIHDLVDLAHLESGRLGTSPEPVRIKEVLKNALQAVQPLAAERNVTVRLDIGTCRDSHVRADRGRLRQALLNVLSGVIRTSHSGGEVSLTCRQTPGNRMRIEICDDARVTEDHSRRLFTPAELLSMDLANLEDSELGLTLTQRLVKEMGGNIGLESTAASGNHLFLEFFLLDDPLERLAGDGAAMLALSQGVQEPQQATVLYFEDNPANLALIEHIFAYRPGIVLLKARDARTGLDLAHTHTPDWILLDLNLPDMPGEAVVRHLRESRRTCHIPISVLSADATPETIRKLVAAGARDYLTKPLDIQKLLALLDDTFRTRA
jgi:signal transduction histidine kinase/CheY-like chemotaxis protein